MKSTILYLAFLLSCAEAYSQRTCKVVDMLTRLPLADVRVIADHYESKAVATNREGDFIILSDDYKFLTLNADGYLTRILSVKEVGDTIELLSNCHRRDEFVVYGKDPIKNAAFNRELAKLRREHASLPKAQGMDILGLFRRKVSSRKREERLKAIENY